MLSSFISDPGIICFQHCTSKVFCFNLPDKCPICNLKFDEKTLKLLPFRLPYPFIKASQYPCSVVLRPTSGDFLNDYNNSKDLHIAVTTSKGIIVEFDRNGLQRHSEKCSNNRYNSISNCIKNNSSSSSSSSSSPSSVWSQCLLVENVPEPWYELWDDVLTQICKQSHWTVNDYKEETYNCYTFVLTFLQALCYDKLSQAAQSKTQFCEKYIVPRTTTAGKYISLYRKIRDHKLYVHPIKEAKDNSNCSIKGNLISKLFTIEE